MYKHVRARKAWLIMMGKTINVTFWNDFRHEKINDAVKALYPDGIHAYVKSFLETNDDIKVTLASLDDPDQGLPEEVLNNTDVLLWWGHMHHHEVDDALTWADRPITTMRAVDDASIALCCSTCECILLELSKEIDV